MNDLKNDPMHDDPIIARLRSGLDVLTADVAETPPPLSRDLPLDAAPHRFGRPPADRNRTWLAAAAAALLLAGTAGLWYAGRNDGGSTNLDELPGVVDEQLPLPFVPAGWELVEWDAVRFAVPQSLRVYDGGCSADVTETDTLTLACGDRSGTGEVDEAVTITIADRRFETDAMVDIVGGPNGIGYLDLGGDGCVGCPTYRGYPALEVEIGIAVPAGSGGFADQFWSTVAPSGRWRATNRPAPPIPDDWVEVEYEGLTVTVPPNWPVRELGDGEPGAETCATGFARPEVVTGVDELHGAMRCQAAIGLLRPSDGLRIARTDAMDLDPGWPAGVRRFNIVDPADPHLVVAYVGFGDDPSIGAAIMASMRLTDG